MDFFIAMELVEGRPLKDAIPPDRFPPALVLRYATLARLQKAYEDRDSWMDYLRLDPRLDSSRSDARSPICSAA